MIDGKERDVSRGELVTRDSINLGRQTRKRSIIGNRAIGTGLDTGITGGLEELWMIQWDRSI